MNIPIGLKCIATLCVLKNEEQFLLLKRAKEPDKDKYTPMGGKLVPFESPLEAAIRETFEETGIEVERMKYCGMLTDISHGEYNWGNYVYLAEIDFIPAPPCNEGVLEWIHFEEVLDRSTPKTDWFIYKYMLECEVFAFSAKFDDQLEMYEMREEIEGITVYPENG